MMNRNIIYMLLLTLLTSFSMSCSDDDKPGIANLAALEAKKASSNSMYLTLNDVSTLQLNFVAMPIGTKIPPLSYRAFAGDDFFTVSESGLISAKKIGIDTLEVRALGGSDLVVRYEVRITDHIVDIASIVLTPAAGTMVIASGEEFDLSKAITINPANATVKTVVYESNNPAVATVDKNNGLVKTIAPGKAIITITADDRAKKATATSNITVLDKIPTFFDDATRATWGITTTHPNLLAEAKEAQVVGTPESILDTDRESCLILVKPGKKYPTADGTYPVDLTGQPDAIVGFTLDLKKELEFNYIHLTHRLKGSGILRVGSVRLLGCDTADGTFTELEASVKIPDESDDSAFIKLSKLHKVKFLKVEYTTFDKGSGSTLQVADFKLGIMKD